MNLFFRAKPKIPTSTLIDIDGVPTTIIVRVNARARSYRLSIPHSGGPLLTLPPHGKWTEAEAFLARHRNWLAARTAIHAARLGVTVKAVRMRSQSSRWGSCSSSGNINYNWRLVLAPPFVLDYVAAHEVAHLVEMNHSAAFWATVARTLPEMDRGRAWLKAHGRQLMAHGA